MRLALSALATSVALVAAWWALAWVTKLPIYILPSPQDAFAAGWAQRDFVWANTIVTASEMAAGFAAGAVLGMTCALAMAAFAPARLVLRPFIVASQAIPVFALAPLLVVWLGYGMAPKIAMATIVIFFPVATSFADGLRRASPGLRETAVVMAGSGFGARLRTLIHVTLPGALPALGTGLRVGAGVAGIAAVIGEWVGASSGLGFLMLWANARSQVPLMFAALAVLFVLAIAFTAAIDILTRLMTPWVKETP